MKQKELSVLLRAVVLLCALVALALGLCVGVLTLKSMFIDHNWQSVFLGLFSLMFLPLFLSMWDLWQIFTQIGLDNSFCMDNALRLRRISFYALADTILVLVSLVLLLTCGGIGGGPFLFELFLLIVGIAATVTCSTLSHLTRKAALLKDENDLTI